jgi:fructoselysine-6-P-deglycase FrlB-like protein/hydroxymethylpyrimidine pyrophosphatase-like HAD family hydrolase
VGKPYAKELDLLGTTYAWAMKAPVDNLAAAIACLKSFPLLAVGSGGSLSAASFCAYLHQTSTGTISKAVTPLEAVLSGMHAPSHGVMLLSAGGGNPDVLGATELLAGRELGCFAALCTRKQSALARLAKQHSSLVLVDYELPSGKDGFLATNSLLAMAVLLVRAYSQGESLPGTFSELLGARKVPEFQEALATKAAELWSRRSIVALCSPSTQPAALDLESKCTEAALCNVQVADYRNFAHGRHHWIAKEHGDTAVIAFVTAEVRKIAELTLKALPKDVPTLAIDVGKEGPAAAISALAHTLYLIGAAGVAHSVDPGRPHVPPFGRKIYHLKAFGHLELKNGMSRREEISISRKTAQPLQVLEQDGQLKEWRSHYEAFVTRLSNTTIRALVLDYDGTLCEPSERFGSPDLVLIKRLAQFIKAGVAVGVVTGRGQSVRSALQKAFPKALWRQVVVGYYNGAIVCPLSSKDDLRAAVAPKSPLAGLAQALSADGRLAELSEIEVRPFQISIQPKSEEFRAPIWELLQQHLAVAPGIRLVESGHSIDALAPGVSKLRVLNEICGQVGIDNTESILCIGDSGRWPGNDFELLAGPCSLSVASVSSAPDSCWNIARAENRLTSATREYLEELFALKKGTLVLDRSHLGDE